MSIRCDAHAVRAHPDGSPRPAEELREGHAVPRVRRRILHDRLVARGRRRHRRVSHARVTTTVRVAIWSLGQPIRARGTSDSLSDREGDPCHGHARREDADDDGRRRRHRHRPRGLTDLQGRLLGKRVTGRFFCEEVLAGGGAIEACVYLLAVDVDMTPLPGYDANWANRNGDFRCIPDFATLRIIRGREAPHSCSATSSTTTT